MTAGTTPRPPRKFLPSRTPTPFVSGLRDDKSPRKKSKKMKQKAKLGSRASARCSRRAGRTRASRPRAQADARNRAPHHCSALPLGWLLSTAAWLHLGTIANRHIPREQFPLRPLSRAKSPLLYFTSAFRGAADMAGPDAGLVPVANDPGCVKTRCWI